MAQAQVERESSARCTQYTGKQVDGPLKLPNGILSTCYALNSSNTKRLIVGFEEVKESASTDNYINNTVFNYELVLKFVNAASSKSNKKNREVIMNKHTWGDLQEKFELISTYFNDDYAYYEKYGGQRILNIGNYELFFNTTYGLKSFVLERHPSAGELASFHESQEASQEASQAPTDEGEKKRIKFNFPSIVMQNVTFAGVQAVSKCINAQIARLQEHEDDINTCATFLKVYISDIIQERISSEPERRELLNNVNDFVKFINEASVVEVLYTRVKQNLPQDFTDRYFKIVFEEMLAFNILSMMEKVRKDMFYE